MNIVTKRSFKSTLKILKHWEESFKNFPQYQSQKAFRASCNIEFETVNSISISAGILTRSHLPGKNIEAKMAAHGGKFCTSV